MEFTSKITSKVQPTSNIFKNLTIFIKDPMVMCNIYSDAITFYGMAAVKFWGAEYMEKILNVVDPTKRMILYGSLCLTGPTFGFIVGGAVGSWIGGYGVKTAILVTLLLDLLACGIGFPTPYFDKDTLALYLILSWLFYCFSTAVIPLETGIILTSVDEKIRGDVLSFTNFGLNLIGNLPPSYIYGLIQDHYGKEHPTLAMKCVFYVRLSSLIALIIASIYRYVKKDKTELTKVINEEEDVEHMKKMQNR